MVDRYRHPGGLGRLFKEDPRDIPLRLLQAVEARFTPDMTLQDLADDPRFEHWTLGLLWNYVVSIRPVDPPSPPVAATSRTWDDPEPTLDQGHTNHCVGNGCAQWGNTLPIDDKYRQTDAAGIYYAAKVIDGEPGQENGSYVRSGMKALQNLHRLAAYAQPQDVGELISWILTRGPVTIGSNWYESMFTLGPDHRAPIDATVISPETGSPVAGGHCYLVLGYDPARTDREFECLNSWGSEWGSNGHFFVAATDLERLVFQEQGEAWCAVELALA